VCILWHGLDQLLNSHPQQCCAIDYIIHTVDSATALLNSPRAFPSRLVAYRSRLDAF